MKRKRKKRIQRNRFLLIIIIIISIVVIFFLLNKNKLKVVTVIKEIKEYNYHLNSNSTKIYKKYYEDLEKEVNTKPINEENYAKLITKLFLIDYYTLTNKITNRDIGGIDYIHPNLKDKFIVDSSNTIYKYVKNNLYGNRKQKLPEVSDVEIKNIEKIKYNNKDYKDEDAYKIDTYIKYNKDYDYPKNIELVLIHENNKLVIVEIR